MGKKKIEKKDMRILHATRTKGGRRSEGRPFSTPISRVAKGMLKDWFRTAPAGSEKHLGAMEEEPYQGLPIEDIIKLSPKKSKGHPGGVGLEDDARLKEAISKGLDDKELWKILKHVIESPRGRKYADLVVSGKMEPLTDKPRGAGVGKRHIAPDKHPGLPETDVDAHEKKGGLSISLGGKGVEGTFAWDSGRKASNRRARNVESPLDKRGRYKKDTSAKDDRLRTKWHKKHTDKGKDTSKTKARAPKE